MSRYPKSLPPQGMTEQQYARHRGLSRSSVKQAKAYGRLVLFADGSIDPKASDERWERTRRRVDLAKGANAPRFSLAQIEAWCRRHPV